VAGAGNIMHQYLILPHHHDNSAVEAGQAHIRTDTATELLEPYIKWETYKRQVFTRHRSPW
jgi:hypothetical protein